MQNQPKVRVPLSPATTGFTTIAGERGWVRGEDPEAGQKLPDRLRHRSSLDDLFPVNGRSKA
jgi:hypothetical protein